MLSAAYVNDLYTKGTSSVTGVTLESAESTLSDAHNDAPCDVPRETYLAEAESLLGARKHAVHARERARSLFCKVARVKLLLAKNKKDESVAGKWADAQAAAKAAVVSDPEIEVVVPGATTNIHLTAYDNGTQLPSHMQGDTLFIGACLLKNTAVEVHVDAAGYAPAHASVVLAGQRAKVTLTPTSLILAPNPFRDATNGDAQVFQAGLDQGKAGHWQKAYQSFLNIPSNDTNVLFNRAVAAEHVGRERDPEAWAWYRETVHRNHNGYPWVIDRAKRAIARLEAAYAVLKVKVDSHSLLTVGEHVVGPQPGYSASLLFPSPGNGRIAHKGVYEMLLLPGQYDIEVERATCTQSISLALTNGQSVSRDLECPTEPPSRWPAPRIASVVGGSLALIGGAVLTGLMVSEKSKADSVCPVPGQCSAGGMTHVKRGTLYGEVGVPLMLVGGVVGVAGYFWFDPGPSPGPKRDTGFLHIRPTFGLAPTGFVE